VFQAAQLLNCINIFYYKQYPEEEEEEEEVHAETRRRRGRGDKKTHREAVWMTNIYTSRRKKTLQRLIMAGWL
jgi:hypothetical protein